MSTGAEPVTGAGVEDRSERAEPPARSRRTRLVVVLVAAVLCLGTSVSTKPWKGYNGDQYYYISAAMQYAGSDYDYSLRSVARAFDYPVPAYQLDRGYLSPMTAPLIYPRVVTPILAAPEVAVAGVRGAYGPGFVLGTLMLLLLAAVLWRRAGPVAAAVAVALLLGSYACRVFLFGIFSEVPLTLLTVLFAITLPTRTRRTGWWAAAAAAGLVPVMLLTRQVPLLPVGMVLGGWLWCLVGERRLRNAYLPHVATVVPTTVATYLVLDRWAPYDPLLFLEAQTRTSSLRELLPLIPGRAWSAMRTDVVQAYHTDRFTLLLFGLALVACVALWRSPMVGVFLGSLGSGLATVALNGLPSSFRYLIPSAPIAAGLVGVMVARWLAVRLPASTDGSQRRRWPLRLRPSWGAAGAWALTAAVVVATVVLYRPASLHGARTAAVSADQYPTWPFTVSSGQLSCAGDDYQVWFTTSGGQRYAVSGTAMAHSFFTPRIAELRRGEPTFSWPELTPILDKGITLCSPDRHFMGRRPRA